MTIHGKSKKSLKRKSNDELFIMKQNAILLHAQSKKAASYGAMGHAAELNCKIDKELKRRGVIPMTTTPVLRLVEASKFDSVEEISALAV
jgi:hypothetical protein